MIKKHLKIFLYHAQNSIQRDLTYRLDFISNIVSSLGWTNYTLILILVLSSSAGGFGGWSKEEMLLLAASWMINNGLAYFLFYRNIKRLVKDIYQGGLDFILLKPIDSQFMVSLRRVILNSVFGALEGLIVIAYALVKLQYTPSLSDIASFFLLTGASLCIYYSLWFFAGTLTLHFGLADNLFYVVPELGVLSKFPVSAYPKPVGYVLSSILPILVMTTFPANAVLGRLPWQLFVYALALSALLIWTTRKFWHWSLRRYTSAN